MQKLIVTINGRDYDTRTGMPVQSSRTPSAQPTVHSANIHTTTQKSRTLNRRFVHNPYASVVKPALATAPELRTSIQAAKVNQTPQITKFYREPVAAPANTPKRTFSDIRPMTHPIEEKVKAMQIVATPVKSSPKPSDVLKREAIAESLAKAPSHSNAKQVKQKKEKRSKWTFAKLATAGATLVLIGGYFTYLNMPSLSVRIAAAQAGIDASYPTYRPSGYSLSGPIAYDNGQVRMRFAMNGTDRMFNLDQTKSAWDSSAVYENFVKPKVGEDYLTTRSNGLTIYTYDNNAAWVNNGILYTISGDAPLSPEQIKHIAASM